MKKIFTLFMPLLILIMTSCSFDESSKLHSEESVQETLAAGTGEEIDGTEAILETVLPTTTPFKTISKAEKINLGEIDEWSFNSCSKFIYFTDFGRYYPIEIGGRQSANYVLCLDTGDGALKILTETEDYISYYCDENNIYIYKTDWLNYNTGVYKLGNDILTEVKVISKVNEGNKMYPVYFTNNYIYYCLKNKNNSSICRMDYEGNNAEKIVDFGNTKNDLDSLAVYDNKIWYDFSTGQGLAYYDLITGETESFDKGKIGIINNGYMYYTHYEESGKLLRFNLSSYEYEIVCETEDNKHLFAFDFHKDYILYSSGSCLYKMNDNENTLIFSAENYFENEGYEIRDIQCQDNHIYILIGSGAFYQCIMEIDIDGNIVEVIHED